MEMLRMEMMDGWLVGWMNAHRKKNVPEKSHNENKPRTELKWNEIT